MILLSFTHSDIFSLFLSPPSFYIFSSPLLINFSGNIYTHYSSFYFSNLITECLLRCKKAVGKRFPGLGLLRTDPVQQLKLIVLWCGGKSTDCRWQNLNLDSCSTPLPLSCDLKQVTFSIILSVKTSELDKINVSPTGIHRRPVSESPGMLFGNADAWAPLHPAESYSFSGDGRSRSGRWSLEHKRDPKSTFLIVSQVTLVLTKIWDPLKYMIS